LSGRGTYVKEDWKEYNERLVRRGTPRPPFLRIMGRRAGEDEQWEEGSPFSFPRASYASWSTFMFSFFHTDRWRVSQALSRFVPELEVADYSTLCKGYRR